MWGMRRLSVVKIKPNALCVLAFLVVGACQDPVRLDGPLGGASVDGAPTGDGMAGESSSGSSPGTGGASSGAVTGGREAAGGAMTSVGVGAAAGESGIGGSAGSPTVSVPFPCLESNPSTCDFGSDFVMIWNPPLGGTGLPLVEGGTYDFVVDWGDGTSGHVTSADDPDARHSYPTPNDPNVIWDESLSKVSYGVRVSGTLRGWSTKQSKVPIEPPYLSAILTLEVLNWGALVFGSTEGQFAGIRLVDSAPDAPDLSETTSLRDFLGSPKSDRSWYGSLSGSVGNWDLSTISDLSGAFRSARIIGETGLSNWDVSNVLHMDGLFQRADCESDISTWNVGQVVTMNSTFQGAKLADDLADWDVSNVTSMSYMFAYSKTDADISAWDVSNVTDMSHMFDGADFDGDISGWDVSRVEDMSSMFAVRNYVDDVRASDCLFQCSWLCEEGDCNCRQKCEPDLMQRTVFRGDLSQWDTSSVTNMSGMFYASFFAGDISTWDVTSVTNMSQMFAGAAFNGDLSSWNVSAVGSMVGMFGKVQEAYVEKESLLDRANYDALLVSWSTLPVQTGVHLDVNAQYSAGAAASARQTLIDSSGWLIADEGQASP
jgi:hypothetical protein